MKIIQKKIKFKMILIIKIKILNKNRKIIFNKIKNNKKNLK